MVAVPIVAAVAPPVVRAVVVVVAVAFVVVDVGLQQVVAPLRWRHILCTEQASFTSHLLLYTILHRVAMV